MILKNYIFFYEDTNATKDSGSLISFFDEGGYWRETNGMVDYVSYPIQGGVMLEQMTSDTKGEFLVQICVLWQKKPAQSFTSM